MGGGGQGAMLARVNYEPSLFQLGSTHPLVTHDPFLSASHVFCLICSPPPPPPTFLHLLHKYLQMKQGAVSWIPPVVKGCKAPIYRLVSSP